MPPPPLLYYSLLENAKGAMKDVEPSQDSTRGKSLTDILTNNRTSLATSLTLGDHELSTLNKNISYYGDGTSFSTVPARASCRLSSTTPSTVDDSECSTMMDEDSPGRNHVKPHDQENLDDDEAMKSDNDNIPSSPLYHGGDISCDSFVGGESAGFSGAESVDTFDSEYSPDKEEDASSDEAERLYGSADHASENANAKSRIKREPSSMILASFGAGSSAAGNPLDLSSVETVGEEGNLIRATAGNASNNRFQEHLPEVAQSNGNNNPWFPEHDQNSLKSYGNSTIDSGAYVQAYKAAAKQDWGSAASSSSSGVFLGDSSTITSLSASSTTFRYRSKPRASVLKKNSRYSPRPSPLKSNAVNYERNYLDDSSTSTASVSVVAVYQGQANGDDMTHASNLHSATRSPLDSDSVETVDEEGNLVRYSAASVASQYHVIIANHTITGDSTTAQKAKSRRASMASDGTIPASNLAYTRLSRASKEFDLDGDGVLDPIEQAMRNRDVNGDGRLDEAEEHLLVQDQMEAQQDVHFYKKVTTGLVCLVVVLALSNFGTSWASAVLARDTVVESESGTIQTTGGDVIGFQDVAYTYELDSLSEEEFEERRQLVEAEMLEDPEHEDHEHRKLGKKKKKKNKNNCNCSKISYDHGKIRERDLDEITRKCDGANTVNIKRKWWRDRDAFYAADEEYDTICEPGTQVEKKGRKKRNKNKKKTKVVNDRVSFKKKGKNGKDKSITFDCKKGQCYASGGGLLQGPGRPCRIELDYDGAGECEEDLICYHPDGKTRGSGVCTQLQMYARNNQVCDFDFGVDACASGYTCYSRNGPKKKAKVGQVQSGICQPIKKRAGEDDSCNTSYDDNACINGFTCLGANGRKIGRTGVGYCTRSTNSNGNDRNGSGWYRSDASSQCVNDGNNKSWNEIFGSAKQCCEQALWWLSKSQCAPSNY